MMGWRLVFVSVWRNEKGCGELKNISSFGEYSSFGPTLIFLWTCPEENSFLKPARILHLPLPDSKRMEFYQIHPRLVL